MDNGELVYSEVFEKTTMNPEYVYKEMLKLYTADKGWVVGTPEVTDLKNGEFKLRVKIEKYKTEEKSFGGR